MFAVLLIIFGSILIGLTSNSLGATGNNIMHLAGIGCLIAAIFIVKGRPLSSTFSYDYYKIESNSYTYSSKVVFNNETI
jgi:hypothetical protein